MTTTEDRATAPTRAEPAADGVDKGVWPESDYPSHDQVVDFFDQIGEQRLKIHRLGFTEVDARRTTGHVQGIAGRFRAGDVGDGVALYASLSHFPPGWGACLIERGAAGSWPGLEMEAMSLPQGNHPGGINICDDLLVIPVEHDQRPARIYLYDVGSDPLYPHQVGALDPSFGSTDVWPPIKGSNQEKASAAGIANLADDWTGLRSRPPLDKRNRYLVANLSEQHFLRFFRFERKQGEERYRPDDDPIGLDMRVCPQWPTGFVDNISLINLSDGSWGLIVFSADKLRWLVKLQKKSTVDRMTFFTLTFEPSGDGTVPTARLVHRKDAEVRLADRSRNSWERFWPGARWGSPVTLAEVVRADRSTTHREQFWPGFRWGASLAWTGTTFALLMAEWFGDEEAKPGTDGREPPDSAEAADVAETADVAESGVTTDRVHEAPPERAGRRRFRPPTDGSVMYVQFATNLETDPFGHAKGSSAHFGAGHASVAVKPSRRTRYPQYLRDLFPVAKLAINEGGRIAWAALLLAFAIALLSISVPVATLTGSLLLAGFGSVVGFIGIGVLGAGVDDALGQNRTYRIWVGWISFAAALGAAVAALWLFVAERRGLVALACAGGTVSAGIFYHAVVRPWLDRRIDPEAAEAAEAADASDAAEAAEASEAGAGPAGLGRRLWFWSSVVVSTIVAALALVLADGLDTDGGSQRPLVFWLLIGAMLGGLLTIVKFLAWPVLRSTLAGPFSWRSGLPVKVVLALLLALSVGVVGLVVAGRTGPAIMALAWAALVLVSVWGAVEYQRPRPGERYLGWLYGFGLAATLGAYGVSYWATSDAGVSLLFVVIAATIGLFVVWPGEAGLVLVAIAFVMAWAAADLDDARPQDRDRAEVGEDATVRWVVALGDSFISGEGAGTFYDGTNHPGVGVCRRAPTAWPDLVGDHLASLEGGKEVSAQHQVRVKSFACSGATIEHITATPQHPEASGEVGGQNTQLAELAAWLDSLDGDEEIAYVLVSAGGNDAGFAEVIEACLTPATACDEIIDEYRHRAGLVEPALGHLLAQLDTTVLTALRGSEAARPTVIVNPYLDPFGDSEGPRCGTIRQLQSLITGDEVGRVSAFRNELNTRLERAVNAHRAGDGARLPIEFNTAGSAVDGNLCQGSKRDQPVRQNWLVLQPPDEVGTSALSSFSALIPSSIWFNGSVHPNEAGHRDIADTVCSVVTSIEDPESRVPGCADVDTISVGQADDPMESLVCDPAASSHEEACREEAAEITSAWVGEQQRDAVIWLGGSFVAGIVGGTLLGSVAAHDSRIRRRRQPPPTEAPGTG